LRHDITILFGLTALEIILSPSVDEDDKERNSSLIQTESNSIFDSLRLLGGGDSGRNEWSIFEDQDRDDEKPWKQARYGSQEFEASLNDIDFLAWQGEQQANLESNILRSFTHADIEPAGSSQMESVAPTYQSNLDLDRSSDEEDDLPQSNKPHGRRRNNVREHSKAQREKRKAAVSDLESAATALSEQLNDTQQLFRANLEKLGFRRKYCHDTLKSFLSLWISGDASIDKWQLLSDHKSVEMCVPITTTRFAAPNPIVSGRRVLRGLPEIMADSSSFAVMCSSVSGLGPHALCSLTLAVDIPYGSFKMDGYFGFSQIRICSTSSLLAGGLREISVDGLLSPPPLFALLISFRFIAYCVLS
jgi:hypothetical protein